MRIRPDNEKLVYSGRIDWSDPEEPVFVYPCTSVGMRFTGNVLKAHVRNRNAYWNNYLGCIVDGKQTMFSLPQEGTALLEIEVGGEEDQEHDKAWDVSIGQVVCGLEDRRITQCLFRRNGKGTPGHLRIAEAEEMAEELAAYIAGLNIDGWEK